MAGTAVICMGVMPAWDSGLVNNPIKTFSSLTAFTIVSSQDILRLREAGLPSAFP